MTGVSRRPLPDLPWISAFPELNVRTYVEQGGRPGVWFLSLDARNPLAVWAARRFFRLPYFRARMSVQEADGRIRYESVRRPGQEPLPGDGAAAPGGGSKDGGVESRVGDPLAFSAEYAPTSEARRAEPGSLEHWLTERYCLYAVRPDGGLLRTDVHHRPWPLQDAEADIRRNGLGEPWGLSCQGPPALLHFSRRLDVLVWGPEEVSGT